MRITTKWMKAALAGALVLAPVTAFGAVDNNQPKQSQTRQLTRLEDDIRHQLVMMPWYSVFDQIQFKVDGRHVALLGAVTRPTLKSDAERIVKRIEGVESVSNNIEVLPLSPMDDRIRLALARAIYGYNSPLFRYGLGANPSIRIIVKNGNVTLAGVVGSEFDRNVANLRANQVSGVFSVMNNLVVDKG